MTLLHNLSRRLRPYRNRFIIGTVLRALGDVCTLYPAYALAFIITTLSKGEFVFADIVKVLVLWCLIMTVRQVFLFYSKYLIYRTGIRMEVDVLQEGLDHMVLLDSAWHEEENNGNKIKRLQNGAEAYHELMRIWVNNFIEIIVNFIGICIITAQTDMRVSWIIIIYIVVYYVISRPLLKRGGEAARAVNVMYEEANGVLFESVNSIRTVKLMSLKDHIVRRYQKMTNVLVGGITKRFTWFQRRNALTNIWTHILSTSALGFIAWGIVEGRYEVGFIALFFTYFGSIRDSVTELANISETIMVANQRIERYEEFKNIEINTESGKGKISFPKNWQEIILENVSFSYNNQAILKRFNLRIRKGEKIGIVGLSGAGKSTLFKLLLKEREDYQGTIRIDGILLRDISAQSYRSRIGVMLQDTDVFNMSLKENIAIGTRASNQYFKQVLDIAHVREFAGQLKKGLDTMIGEKGVKLSGGQRQRVGIARALLKRPEILFFDEATSHLDIESEAKIRDSLHKAFKDITAVVIAHRLSTIKEMDRIIVIEKGSIIEEGSFADLQKKQGRFFDLWEQQKIL